MVESKELVEADRGETGLSEGLITTEEKKEPADKCVLISTFYQSALHLGNAVENLEVATQLMLFDF